MELNTSPSSVSPSFNSYSHTTFSHIAQRVIQEFREQTEEDNDEEEDEEFDFVLKQECTEQSDHDVDEAVDDEQEEQEFEFHFHVEAQNPLKPADEIFQNGLIRPVYLFSDPIIDDDKGHQKIRVSLRKLFMEETDQTATSSTSDDDDDEELAGVPPEIYCVWRPGTAAAAGLCKKSGSTGSVSKKWKLRDILMNNRSRSDGGKGSLVFPSEGSDKTATYGGEKMKRRITTSYRQDLAGVLGTANAQRLR